MKKKTVFVLVALAVLLVAGLLGLCAGRYSLSPIEVVSVLLGQSNPSVELVVYKLRLPRLICAILIGGALSAAGMAFQGLFQNPLVSPDILGVSSGACVGAVASILLGWGTAFTMLLAFSTGVASVAVAILLTLLTRRSKNTIMVFAGIIVGRFMSSIVGILIFFADDESQLGAIVEWEMGSLAKVTTTDLFVFGPLLTVSIAVLLLLRWRINLLSVGEGDAKALGVNVTKESLLVIGVATFATALSVCVAGTIAWIGLIIPHISRWLIRDDNRYSMPLGVLLGSVALIISDTVARTLLPFELPLEVITGLAGAPIFAWIMVKRWKE